MKIWRSIKQLAEKIMKSELWCLFFHKQFKASADGHYICQKNDCRHKLRLGRF